MAEFVKLYRESIPAARLIGKRYTEDDKINGSYGPKWGEWFQKNWFAPLETLPLIEYEAADAYIGAIHFLCGDFQYWIGMLCKPDTQPPEGYGCVDLAAGELAVGWVKGKENGGDLYMQDKAFLEHIAEKGWQTSDRAWFFERYACPRFTSADEHGDVILDYCIYLQE